MTKTILAGLLATVALGAPALANHHEEETMATDAMSVSPALQAVLDDERRANDKARDVYRHPGETLTFFQVEPTHTVVEYAPGGGWYTRVIAPYVGAEGRYIAGSWAPYDTMPEGARGERGRFEAAFPPRAAEMTGLTPEQVTAITVSEAPEELMGTVDRIIIPRMMHNMIRWGIVDSELMAMRKLLKDDGMIGIVQHMAPEDQSYAMTDGSRGYLKKSAVIDLMNAYGFELVAESDINLNPADTADYEQGVWTLPPSFALKEQERDKYAAIGESSRMTLLFKKAD